MGALTLCYLAAIVAVREWTRTRVMLYSLPPVVAASALFIWKLGEVALADLPTITH